MRSRCRAGLRHSSAHRGSHAFVGSPGGSCCSCVRGGRGCPIKASCSRRHRVRRHKPRAVGLHHRAGGQALRGQEHLFQRRHRPTRGASRRQVRACGHAYSPRIALSMAFATLFGWPLFVLPVVLGAFPPAEPNWHAAQWVRGLRSSLPTPTHARCCPALLQGGSIPVHHHHAQHWHRLLRNALPLPARGYPG